MEITSINQLDLSQDIYTYADYLLWQFKQVLENGSYRGLAPIVEGKTIHSVKFPDLSFNTKTIFEE
jgi:hypothetical protein|nr:hypothetical protein [uncultured Capnocytophaga sp.]